MNQKTWDAMTTEERKAARDLSSCNAQLLPYCGRRVRVEPKREYGRSTFRVGMTTGWAPVLLAVRKNAHGSSDVIDTRETFTRIIVLA